MENYVHWNETIIFFDVLDIWIQPKAYQKLSYTWLISENEAPHLSVCLWINEPKKFLELSLHPVR